MVTIPIEVITIAPIEHAAKIERREQRRKSFDSLFSIVKHRRLNLQRFFLRPVKRHDHKHVIT